VLLSEWLESPDVTIGAGQATRGAAGAGPSALGTSCGPGELTLRVDRPATYDVYAEATLSPHPSIRVTGPTGEAIAVEDAPRGPSYDHGGSFGTAVGTFHATTAGHYRIAVATSAAAQGEFAVGEPFPLWMRLLPDPVAWAILAVGVGSAIAIAAVTAFQGRRGGAL
jgi:hypothetical protein